MKAEGVLGDSMYRSYNKPRFQHQGPGYIKA